MPPKCSDSAFGHVDKSASPPVSWAPSSLEPRAAACTEPQYLKARAICIRLPPWVPPGILHPLCSSVSKHRKRTFLQEPITRAEGEVMWQQGRKPWEFQLSPSTGGFRGFVRSWDGESHHLVPPTPSRTTVPHPPIPKQRWQPAVQRGHMASNSRMSFPL